MSRNMRILISLMNQQENNNIEYTPPPPRVSGGNSWTAIGETVYLKLNGIEKRFKVKERISTSDTDVVHRVMDVDTGIEYHMETTRGGDQHRILYEV